MSVFYVFSNYSSTRFFRDLASAFIDVLILSITFWISVASSLIFVFKSLDVGRKYLWILENLSYWSAYFSAYISSRSSKLWPWCSSIMDHFEHNEILHSLQKKYQSFVLDEDCLSPQETDVCGVGKGQCHEIWILNSSHARPCNAHTMVDDKCCSKTGHSPDSIHYHKLCSASEQLIHQKALSSLITEYWNKTTRPTSIFWIKVEKPPNNIS